MFFILFHFSDGNENEMNIFCVIDLDFFVFFWCIYMNVFYDL